MGCDKCEMGCDKCEKEPIRGAFLRWKYATIEIIACKEHWLEIRNVLSLTQRPEVGEEEIEKVIDSIPQFHIRVEGEVVNSFAQSDKIAQALLKHFNITLKNPEKKEMER